jgi:hypothetical protein
MPTITEQPRWTRGGYARQYSWPQCRFCGRAQTHDCPRVECMLCGSPQCFGNGSGNGCCAVCHHGYLPGWSRIGRTVCGYAGCDHEAVAFARKRPVCTGHAERVKVARGLVLTDYVAEQIARRDAGKGWERWQLT